MAIRRDLLDQTEAAELLKTTPRTISGLVAALGLVGKPTGRPGKSVGLDRDDIAALRAALTPPRKARKSRASA